MKVKPYVSSGWGLRFLIILFLLDILSLLGSFYNPFLPIIFVYLLWFSSVMGLMMFFTRRERGDDDVPVRWIRIRDTGFIIDNRGKVTWGSVSGVNLSVFVEKITVGPRFRNRELDAGATAKIRPMSGGGFLPELTHTLYYGVLTVYTQYNSAPAIEFKCRIPWLMPHRLLRRIKKIGIKNGSGASFTFHTHKDGQSQKPLQTLN